jgi:hypothetical protein
MQCVESSNFGPHHYQIQSPMFIKLKASVSQKRKLLRHAMCPYNHYADTTHNCTQVKLSQCTPTSAVAQSLMHSPLALSLYWLFSSRMSPDSRRTGRRPWPVRSRRHSGWRQARTESRASIVSSPHPRRSNSSTLLTGAAHQDRAL